MKNEQNEMQIPMQVGSELRIRQDGSVVIDNPELELAQNPEAADAVLSYRFDAAQGLHILRLMEPVADHKHTKVHRRGD